MENLFSNELEEKIFYPEIMLVENFMVGGLVGYADVDDGTYLLRKEVLEEMLPTIIGKPLIVDHQQITKENIKEITKGSVIDAWFNTETGQFDCKIIVEDEELADAIRRGNNKVSSAYSVTQFGEGGRYSGIEYDAEILGGVFNHLAIVENPRYPDGKILVNNIQDKGENCMFFKLNKQNEEEKEQKVNEEDLIEIDGEKVELKDLIDAYKNSCKKNEDEAEKENEEEEKKDEEEKENACKKNEADEEKENEDSDDELITKIRKVVKEMLEAKENKKNEDEEEKENEEEKEKENKIASYSKSNSLRVASQSAAVEKFEFKTRAERIAESNKKYSL